MRSCSRAAHESGASVPSACRPQTARGEDTGTGTGSGAARRPTAMPSGEHDSRLDRAGGPLRRRLAAAALFGGAILLIAPVTPATPGTSAALAATAPVAAAQPQTQPQSPGTQLRVIPRLDDAIVLDGRVDEAAWDQAMSLPLIQHRPNFRDEPSQATEILIGYTETHLYLACRCLDTETPAATSLTRDYVGSDLDYVGLVLDTFDDNENALAFFTSPTGHRTDAAVSNDATGRPFDASWNAFWDVAVTQDADGWYAELQVPISTLRFQERADGGVQMGLIAWRFFARDGEVAIFPEVPPNWSQNSIWKPSQAETVVFEELSPRTPLRATPYALAGVAQQPVLEPGGAAYETNSDPAYDAGVDIKYGLTGNMTLDLTLNTDFAQAEADNEQVNLTRFSLFFPEKRRFFQERASNFEFNFGGQDRLFYSRRIGLAGGQQVRILGGARLVGRTGPWDVGVLTMQTGREDGLGPGGADLPGENFGVARLRRRVLNPYSYVGGILTSRLGADGAYNIAYGLDGLIRVAEDEFVTLMWAQTFDDAATNRLGSLDPARLLVQWERRGYAGLGYDLSYARAGEEYDPGVGYQRRRDYFVIGDRISYGWIPGPESPLQQHQLRMRAQGYFRNVDRSLESLTFGPEWQFRSNSTHSLTLRARRTIEDLDEPFTISGAATVPAGRHTFDTGEISYGLPAGWPLRTSVSLSAGGFYDGRRQSARISPSWNASQFLRLSGAYQLDRIEFSERDESLTSHVARVRLVIAPNVRYSIQPFVQYNSATDGIVGNLRFRYNPSEGTDLYIVYNERLNTARDALAPVPPLSTDRTVLVKYSHTLDW